MDTDREWLFERLRSEPRGEGESERRHLILSRLRPLTRVGESKGTLRHDELGQEPEMMNIGERRLVSLASALIGDSAQLSAAERKLAARTHPVDSRICAHARAQILAGNDFLGAEFCLLRNAKQRRRLGATYTPAPIVDAMLEWAQREVSAPARVVDPGVGSGRFLIAAARKFPRAELIAVDVDPLATLMLRANAIVLGFANRLAVHLADYRSLALPAINGATLFIGNPPYVRHHDISEQWKAWFAATAKDLGFNASKLAGLHVHFFLKTRELAQSGDYGAFVTAAEWLDVNYGSVLRRMLADGLGGTAVHIIDPKAQPFADAMATGAITCFRVGSKPTGITLRSVGSLSELAPLGRGRTVAWQEIARAPKWSIFLRERNESPSGFIELGELFRVHRGQVTGCNDVWIDSGAGRHLPKRFKPLTVTKARQLIAAGPELDSSGGLSHVVDLPADLDALDAVERRIAQQFLDWAKRHGAHEGYIAKHRRAWWSVGLRAPAPILCTYMARRAPAFVRNVIKARHINIAHGLYPRGPLDDAMLTTVLAYLRRHISTAGGRTYAGGLVKFEPKELERIFVPRIEDMHGYLAEIETAPETLDGSRVAS